MKNYIGKKIRGFRFRFEHETDNIGWSEYIERNIGKIGEIVHQSDRYVTVNFEKESWNYPISLVEQHLVEEEIPELGDGVLMEVSDNGGVWHKSYVIAKSFDGIYIGSNFSLWKYARPIVKKYTKEELIKIIGHDFRIKE